MWISDKWQDYELLDCGGGKRFERWGEHYLVRPDPQAIWQPSNERNWSKANATYHRSQSGGGKWEIRSLPESWHINYGSLRFNVKPMNFKHTGIFPEQAANWDFISSMCRTRKQVNILNLFAYTGGATMAAAAAGANVCHVDAAKGMVSWAKENAKSSGLSEAPIRYIVDDCAKFIRREITRGRRYDGIIMDPPSYGRGPSGEIWRFEDNIYDFVKLCSEVLSDNPLFVVLNSYTAGISPSVSAYLLGSVLSPRFGGSVQSGELGLPVSATGLSLPCGATGRWMAK